MGYLKVFFLLILQYQTVIGLRLKNVTIPHFGMKDGKALLSCEFDLLPSDNLLFLKWYKNDAEFFRFTPSSPDPILTFPLEGVFVEESQSNINQLMLKNLSLETSGVYKCEAMAESTFHSPSGTGTLLIIAPPEKLALSKIHPFANIGDRINGNCTSYRSRPAALLNIYVNGIILEHSEIIEYESLPQSNGLENSIVGFSFVVERGHFQHRTFLEIKCTATIFNLYWIRNVNVSEANINAQPSYKGQSRLSFSTSSTSKVGGSAHGLAFSAPFLILIIATTTETVLTSMLIVPVLLLLFNYLSYYDTLESF